MGRGGGWAGWRPEASGEWRGQIEGTEGQEVCATSREEEVAGECGRCQDGRWAATLWR